ncbi:RNA binding protein precursor [Zea mays]|jgi:dsRNA-specific ribonuclease|uniref:RNA binding protein n=1 Tax=Zea mays TaxID=4577 RepID=B6SGY5_MAIZE|nr:RNA binding protein precursor [Zea mays]ACG24118.1 RNA binding protein [Zea mays]AQK61531.1 RNA binding protein [Zea mays]|eukprot:NP_001146877.1 RNA binding protein precursor [Zea mays]
MATPTPPPLVLILLLLVASFPSPPRATASASPFDAALAALQSRVGYAFRAPALLRRAMTHSSYSHENGRALAVLGLAAAESAAALRALAADADAAPSAVSRAASEAASGPACARAGARIGIPDVVRVSGQTSAAAPTVVCSALRALVGAVAVDANSTDAAGEVFWRLHALTSSAAVAAV